MYKEIREELKIVWRVLWVLNLGVLFLWKGVREPEVGKDLRLLRIWQAEFPVVAPVWGGGCLLGSPGVISCQVAFSMWRFIGKVQGLLIPPLFTFFSR